MVSESKERLKTVVTVDPEIMHGSPCFTGTRVLVQSLLDYLEEGYTLDEFLADFTTVRREQATGFLELAAERLVECASC